MQQPRVAVIGAGPSGLYAVAALLGSGVPVSVTVLDRLPAPYGLVRYGVAPDHVKMKSVIRVLQQPFAGDGVADVEFLGDVHIGDGGVPVEALRQHFHAVVHATGSPIDRCLGVPGEELDGSFGSGAFVSWYCGHPDQVGLDPLLDHPGVAVVGAGNVALDVARVLARSADEMAGTDVPDPVLDALRASAVTDVHVLIRRGPAARPVHPGRAAPDRRAGRRRRDRARRRAARGRGRRAGGAPAAAEPGHPDRLGRRRPDRPAAPDPPALPAQPDAAARRPQRPGAGVVVERNVVEPDGRVRGTGELETLDVGLVVRAIGYAAQPIPGLPFDERTGTVPQRGRPGGRADGVPVPGAYVTGWIKRGPERRDRHQQGRRRRDRRRAAGRPARAAGPAPARAGGAARHAAAHGIRPVDWAAWLRLDAEELRRGGLRGAERVKVAELAEMLAAAHTAPAR